MKKIFLLGIGLLLAQIIFGQSKTIDKKKLKEFRNNPVWITMMDDSTVNYYEAQIAFDEFWRGKQSPGELNEGEHGEEEEHERSIAARILKSDKRYKEEIVQYAFEHKKFKYWLRKNAPYVKEDGTVMSQSEKDALVQQELANRNAASNSK